MIQMVKDQLGDFIVNYKKIKGISYIEKEYFNLKKNILLLFPFSFLFSLFLPLPFLFFFFLLSFFTKQTPSQTLKSDAPSLPKQLPCSILNLPTISFALHPQIIGKSCAICCSFSQLESVLSSSISSSFPASSGGGRWRTVSGKVRLGLVCVLQVVPSFQS